MNWFKRKEIIFHEDELHATKGITAATRDSESPVWDMSQERLLVENLLGTRFNFFIVLFGLFIAASLNAKDPTQLRIVLTTGFVICILLRSVIARSYERLGLILDDLYDDPSHPASIIHKRSRTLRFPRRVLMGEVIPWICTAALGLGMATAYISPELLLSSPKNDTVRIEVIDQAARKKIEELETEIALSAKKLEAVTRRLNEIEKKQSSKDTSN